LLFGLTTTVSASNAIGSSKYLMPAFAQSSISFFRIGREASEISVSPRQNFLKPPPVPEIPTVTLTAPLVDFWKSSATASVIGYTVLEPSILTIASAWAAEANRAKLAAARTVLFIERMEFSRGVTSASGDRFAAFRTQRCAGCDTNVTAI